MSKRVRIFAVLILALAGLANPAGWLHASDQFTKNTLTQGVVHRVWNSGLYPDESQSPIFWVDDSTILVAATKVQSHAMRRR